MVSRRRVTNRVGRTVWVQLDDGLGLQDLRLGVLAKTASDTMSNGPSAPGTPGSLSRVTVESGRP